MITNQNIPLPKDAMDIYEVAEKYGLSIEEAVQKVRDEKWTFVGYNDYGQEAYANLQNTLVTNLREFGYDPIISDDEDKVGYRQLYEFEGWYLNCGVLVPEGQFSEKLYDLYWFGE